MQASNEQCSWVETKVVTGLCQCLCQPIPSEYMKSHPCTLTYAAHSSLCNVWPQIGQWDWVTCPEMSGSAIVHDATTHMMFGVSILSQLLMGIFCIDVSRTCIIHLTPFTDVLAAIALSFTDVLAATRTCMQHRLSSSLCFVLVVGNAKMVIQ